MHSKCKTYRQDGFNNRYQCRQIPGGRMCKAFSDAGYEVSKFVIPAGEENKNLDTTRDIYKYLLGLKLDRSATLMALGGGVVGDITGLPLPLFFGE